MGSGKAPKKTQEQKAMERRQRIALDEETASSERRLKAVAQKKLGKQSLLATASPEVEAPAGPTNTEGYEKVDGQTRRMSDKTALKKMARKAALRIGG